MTTSIGRGFLAVNKVINDLSSNRNGATNNKKEPNDAQNERQKELDEIKARLDNKREAKAIRSKFASNRIRQAFINHRKKVNTLVIQADNNKTNINKKNGIRVTDYVEATYTHTKGPDVGKKQPVFLHRGIGENKMPALMKPMNPPKTTQEGSFKTVETVDKKYVALRLKEGQFEKPMDNSDLVGLPTMKKNTIVTPTLMMGDNAGKIELFDFVANSKSKNGALPEKCFHQAALDLETLHTRHSYLRDIKPENMGYDPDKQQVNFLDLDDRVNLKKTKEAESFGTPGYINYDLVKLIYGKNGKSPLNEAALRVADDYAFLAAFIFSTGTKAVAVHIGDRELTTKGFDHKDALKWIDKNVVPEHKATAFYLISDPSTYATTQKYVSVAKMLGLPKP